MAKKINFIKKSCLVLVQWGRVREFGWEGVGVGWGGDVVKKITNKSKILVLNIKQTKTPYIRQNNLLDKFFTKIQHALVVFQEPTLDPECPRI